MAVPGGNAPSWLFSFVDLAFLLLIAMTQLADDAQNQPDLGEIVVPRISSDATSDLPALATERWQLRIHPADGAAEGPFELVRGDTPDGGRFELAALRERLEALNADEARKPLLAPHEDSRSQDLLDAVSSIEELWPGRRRATVFKLLANR
jgi:hypothetical protein